MFFIIEFVSAKQRVRGLENVWQGCIAEEGKYVCNELRSYRIRGVSIFLKRGELLRAVCNFSCPYCSKNFSFFFVLCLHD